MESDTIAAISTALSDSGIGIIRISGPRSVSIADQIFVTAGKKHILNGCASHTIHYGFIMEDETVVDEVMVSILKGPRSYTKEDTIEINCHGGVYLMQKILRLVVQKGARLAEPGEFTKRAFLNGRIDLSQAEAVMDLIRSRNDFAVRSSLEQLRGSVRDEIVRIRKKILYEIAFIESALDDPEHISTHGYADRLSQTITELSQQIKRLQDTFENGRIRTEGIRTVIIGKPNVGKSSFLNVLSGEERAIVTDIPGTTRDILEEEVRIHGIALRVIDTAGIRSSEDEVEKIGVQRAVDYASRADLILYVADASRPLDENDFRIMDLIEKKKVIVLLNKTDLPVVIQEDRLKEKLKDHITDIRIIHTSMTEKRGMDAFEDAIRELFFQGQIEPENEIVITNIRHAQALKEAQESLSLVKRSLDDKMPEDFFSIDLMSAYASLGKIIGEEVEDDLVEEIFSKFCMGK